MKQKGTFFIGTGASSIVMIFVVLCLTAFGLLALSSAQADFRLTAKSQAAAEAYYEADAQAQEAIEALDRELCGAHAKGSAAYARAVEAITGEGRNVFSVPGGEEHTLYVELTPLPFARETRFEVTRYQWQNNRMAEE